MSEGRCRVRVALDVPVTGVVDAQAEGRDTDSGRLRATADATAQAVERATGGRIGLELLGVKALHTFDCILVVVSLSGHAGPQSERLVGSCIVPDEHPRGAALAVLNATNRLLSVTLELEL